ncbi:hypothetical protein acdb102_15660 [Acidothermaceae bacterium B102]|nr:hypothetical protein acdb102_15660 [Acidothermaceae bacterium B102]
MTTDDDHVDLLGLLEGELGADERAEAVAHLRGCTSCADGFLDMAIAIGRLRDAGRYPPADPSEVPPLRLDRSAAPEPGLVVQVPAPRTAPRRRRLLRPALVAVALVAALGGGIAIGRSGTGSPAGGVTLTAVGLPTVARGQAHMLGSGEAQQMQVTVTGLTVPVAADHYEVWLLDTTTGRAVAVGTITGGTSTFALPVSRTVGFDAIDVSLQTPADGTTHSGHSVLRGTIA